MSKPIVVVVDDDEDELYLARRTIRNAGIDAKIVEYVGGDDFYSVVSNESRRNADLGETPPPIIVLLDINMPGMSGFEVLEKLKGDLGNGDRVVVVVMFTSSSQAEDRASAFEYSFVKDYVVKPLTEEKIQELVRQYHN